MYLRRYGNTQKSSLISSDGFDDKNFLVDMIFKKKKNPSEITACMVLYSWYFALYCGVLLQGWKERRERTTCFSNPNMKEEEIALKST